MSAETIINQKSFWEREVTSKKIDVLGLARFASGSFLYQNSTSLGKKNIGPIPRMSSEIETD